MKMRGVLNARSARIYFQRIEEAASDLTPALEAIGENLRHSVDVNFMRQGRFSRAGSIRGGSQKWEKVNKPPKRGTILCRTGALRRSISSGHSATSAWVGTNKEYAAAQNYGMKGDYGQRSDLKTRKVLRRLRIRLPARPFLVIQPEDIQEAKALLLDHLVGGA